VTETAMPILHFRPALFALCLVLPAGALAATPAMSPLAGAAAVIVWLAGLGWGFHAMLHHRLAAEDRLARLESDVACERDTLAARHQMIRQRLLVLEAEWHRLELCLCDGDLGHVPENMRAMQAAIALLQQEA
jgi:hypothetical protein